MPPKPQTAVRRIQSLYSIDDSIATAVCPVWLNVCHVDRIQLHLCRICNMSMVTGKKHSKDFELICLLHHAG